MSKLTRPLFANVVPFHFVKLLKNCSVSRQRIAELEQRLEQVSEEKENLLERMERRDMQVFASRHFIVSFWKYVYLCSVQRR